ncbi:MAG: hypothetical protein SPJ44_02905 [Treponema sp.]|nr:hypothetical protein [Treponema sp.]
MKITEKQRKIWEIIFLIALILILTIQITFINNPNVIICSVIIIVLGIVIDFVLGIMRSKTIREELLNLKEQNIKEIKEIINNQGLEDLSGIKIDQILNILKSKK